VDAGGGGNVPDASVDARPADAPGGFDAPPGTCGDAGTSTGSAARQTARILGSTPAKQGFLEYLPPACANTGKPPLMIYMHGIGNNGTGTSAAELDKVAGNGTPPGLVKANQWPGVRPWVILSPQQVSGCPSATSIHDFITYAISNYDIDPTRVHLTGLSCGAMGSGQYLAQYGSQQVAAAVMIAGRALPAWTAQGCGLVNDIGLWVFHGDADTTVPISDDNTAMPQFIACPQPPRKDVQYTVYPGVGHDSWTRTYTMSAGHDIYTWFLQFKK
jgi:poly(3-hydroxybutyrate) depolymerase